MFHYTIGNIGTKFDSYFVFYHFISHMFCSKFSNRENVVYSNATAIFLFPRIHLKEFLTSALIGSLSTNGRPC